MMTYSAPASFSMPPLISPVNAPSFSEDMFCPATPTLVLRHASATACSAVNGGRQHDLDVAGILHQAAELLGVDDGLDDRLEHLPVRGKKRGAHDGES